MIRIGCCTNMLADAVDRAGLSYIFKAAQAGFAYVEPPLAEFMNLEEETLLQVERLLKNDKIRVDAFCNLFPASLRLTGPEADLKKADGYMEQALQLAARFGASRVVFGSGAARWVPEGFSRKQAFEQLVILTEHMAKIAEKKRNCRSNRTFKPRGMQHHQYLPGGLPFGRTGESPEYPCFGRLLSFYFRARPFRRFGILWEAISSSCPFCGGSGAHVSIPTTWGVQKIYLCLTEGRVRGENQLRRACA